MSLNEHKLFTLKYAYFKPLHAGKTLKAIDYKEWLLQLIFLQSKEKIRQLLLGAVHKRRSQSGGCPVQIFFRRREEGGTSDADVRTLC